MKLLYVNLLTATCLTLLSSVSVAQINYVVTAGNNTTLGTFNTLVGPGAAGNNSLTGYRNTVMGVNSGFNLTSGNWNSFFGVDAGKATTEGSNNTFMGFETGFSNTSGSVNTMLGQGAGNANTTGYRNTFVGARAGYYNQTGYENSFIGTAAGNLNAVGIYNVFVGNYAGSSNYSGSNNVAVGTGAGSIGQSGNGNVSIGDASGPTGNINNTVSIGVNARASASNTIILGDVNNPDIHVGIGVTFPQFPLDVRGIINIRGGGTLKFAHMSNPNLRNGTTDQFLTVNEQGETVLARYQLRINTVAEWSDKVFAPAYQLRPLSAVNTYVQQHGHLPGVPSAEQVLREGVEPVKMDAKLLEKIEELTLYSIQQQTTIDKQQGQIDELTKLVKQLLDKK